MNAKALKKGNRIYPRDSHNKVQIKKKLNPSFRLEKAFYLSNVRMSEFSYTDL